MRSTLRGAAIFFAVIASFLVTVGLFLGIFFLYGRDYASVRLGREYYFLVRDCEDTTASAVAGQVYLSGGAGYLLEREGESAVVLACYFRRSDAERVMEAMREQVETRVLALATADFSLEGEAAAQKTAVKANVDTVESCAHILYDTANGLERAAISQEEAHGAVKGVTKSLKGLALGNEGELFSRWNLALSRAEKRGRELAEGILFAKDLRYLQTELLLDILSSDAYFS